MPYMTRGFDHRALPSLLLERQARQVCLSNRQIGHQSNSESALAVFCPDPFKFVRFVFFRVVSASRAILLYDEYRMWNARKAYS
jgi:hypothetical protein